MSHDDDDSYWNDSKVKAFDFDNEDQTLSGNIVNLNSSNTISTTNVKTSLPLTTTTSNKKPANKSSSQPSSSLSSLAIKNIGNILAPKSSSNEPFLRPSMIMCDGDKIEKLIEHLDKHFTITTKNDKPKQDPKLYISDIVNKRVAIDFSPYKSKRDKVTLLECAICSADGNTITAAAIFLSKTLKQSLFISELKKRPIAVDHYINYLEMTGRSREVTELTNLLSKS